MTWSYFFEERTWNFQNNCFNLEVFAVYVASEKQKTQVLVRYKVVHSGVHQGSPLTTIFCSSLVIYHQGLGKFRCTRDTYVRMRMYRMYHDQTRNAYDLIVTITILIARGRENALN